MSFPQICPTQVFPQQRHRSRVSDMSGTWLYVHITRQVSGSHFSNSICSHVAELNVNRQHLKRNHRAPIQCHRCWLVMANPQEMSEHANVEPRCDRRIGQPEGVDQEKLDHILSTRGPTWEKIYEILFPGAPIPSPCKPYCSMSGIFTDRTSHLTDFEAQVQLPESFTPSSPASQEHEEFEAYNRRALPALVEANLRAMVNTKMVPIEESLMRLLVDIVRTCQSTVAESFRVTRSPRKVTTKSPQQSSSQAISPLPPRGQTLLTDGQPLAPTIADTTLGFFEEPPHVHVEAGPACLRPPEGTDRLEPPQNQFTDSGYGGFSEACECSCHSVPESINIVNGNFSPCQSFISALTTCRQMQAVAKTAFSITLIYGISAGGV